jgi:hypothetical protein
MGCCQHGGLPQGMLSAKNLGPITHSASSSVGNIVQILRLFDVWGFARANMDDKWVARLSAARFQSVAVVLPEFCTVSPRSFRHACSLFWTQAACHIFSSNTFMSECLCAFRSVARYAGGEIDVSSIKAQYAMWSDHMRTFHSLSVQFANKCGFHRLSCSPSKCWFIGQASPNSIIVIIPTCSTHAAALWWAPGLVFHDTTSFAISNTSGGEWLLSVASNCSMCCHKVLPAVMLDSLIGGREKTNKQQNLFV